jgi:hypothetical protein
MPTQYITGHEQLRPDQAAEKLRMSVPVAQIEGPAARRLYQRPAVEIKPDLIVIGAGTTPPWILLGGVAQQVVSIRAVLVVRRPTSQSARPVVTDGSDCSQKPPVPGAPRRWSSQALSLPAANKPDALRPPFRPSDPRAGLGPGLYPPPLPAVELEALEKRERRAGEQLLERLPAPAKPSMRKTILNRAMRHEIIEPSKTNINLIACGPQLSRWQAGCWAVVPPASCCIMRCSELVGSSTFSFEPLRLVGEPPKWVEGGLEVWQCSEGALR